MAGFNGQSYFENLRIQGKKIDDGIHKLSEKWKSYFMVTAGYGANAAEAQAFAANLLLDIKATRNTMVKEAAFIKEDVLETDKFVIEARNTYESISQQCDDIETVLKEYGYTSALKTEQANEEYKLDTMHMIDNETELTPYLWRNKSRTSEDGTTNNCNPGPIGIATPVIKSLASVLIAQTPHM